MVQQSHTWGDRQKSSALRQSLLSQLHKQNEELSSTADDLNYKLCTSHSSRGIKDEVQGFLKEFLYACHTQSLPEVDPFSKLRGLTSRAVSSFIENSCRNSLKSKRQSRKNCENLAIKPETSHLWKMQPILPTSYLALSAQRTYAEHLAVPK